MEPSQPEEKTTYMSNLAPMNPPTQYGQITASMNSLLPAIQENQTEDPQRPSFKTITTLPRFQTQDSVRYSANQRFKVKKKKRKKRHKKQKDNENDMDNDSDDDGYNFNDDSEPYDIWHRPPIENEQLNEDSKQLILNNYENICNENFFQLLLENETECHKLSELMCNKKLTSKDLSKPNRNCDKYELFDILKLNDPNDTGGLNPDDYDIDMREMEHLFNSFNNNILNQFMESYFDNKLPFESRQPYPMGLIETDITKQRKIKTQKNKNYIAIHRRKHKQRLREKHRKKKEKARKKRRKEKKMKMKLAQKKRDILQEKLSKQLHPDVLNTLFSPDIIDPNAPPEETKEEEEELLELADDNLRTDDEALNNVTSNETKERIKNMRISRQRSRRKDRMSSDRHSAALASPIIDNLKQQYSTEEWESKMQLINNNVIITSTFDDDNTIKQLNVNKLDREGDLNINPQDAPPTSSKDYDGIIKRYLRPIKMDQIEKVYKYVLFKSARQYFGEIFLLNSENIKEKIELYMNEKVNGYNQIKYQIETTNVDKQDVCTGDISINNNTYNEIKCDLDISYYISLRKKRDMDILLQLYRINRQESQLQLLSMGVDLYDIEQELKELKEREITLHEIKQSFMDGNKYKTEEELKEVHDEDDNNYRMAAIVYDSDDDAVNEKRWNSRGKWIEKTLTDYCEKEQKVNSLNPKPWKKLQNKYIDEFIHKFCGFYPNESRPIGWKRIWHSNMSYTKSTDLWPNNWMELFDSGKLQIIGEYNDELNDEKIKHTPIKCTEQISGKEWKEKQLLYGKLFKDNNEMKEFYERVLNNIPRLPLNLEEIEKNEKKLPSFVWNLNEKELSKYGTYLFANWKQSSNGLVTVNNNMRNAGYKFPILQFRTDIEQRKWLSTKKWYIYRCRYWEAEDIEDFLDEVTKDGCEWYGSNDREKHILLEDRICIQNDHCYGKPNLFLWTHDFCNDKNGPIKIRNYGISNDIMSTDPIIQSDKSIFNLDAPIIKTGRIPSDGPIKSGTKLSIGAQDVLTEYSDINGIIAIDCYIPPIFNLSVYNDMDTLYYNWNRVNHDHISDKASSKIMKFINKSQIFDKIVSDENNILKSWDNVNNDWLDYKNYPKFDRYKHSYPSVYNNAFFFHNFLSRTFYYGHKNISKINYPRNWQNALFTKPDEEWTFTFGFTHPRPIAPEKYAILFYKKDAIEVKITTDTTVDKADNNYTDLTPKNIEQKETKEFELIDTATKYKWTQEKLEIVLNIHYLDNNNNNKMKPVVLFSEIIRNNFNHKDCFHEFNKDFEKSKNKKFIFAENYFMSHIVIVTKSKDGYIKCYLNGKIVCNKLITDLIGGANSNKKDIKTNILNINEKNQNILMAHKPGNKKGKAHGLFHGYLYAISLYSIYFQPFELNTLYRQLCVHRDLHVVDTWFNNKNQLSNQIYKQFL